MKVLHLSTALIGSAVAVSMIGRDPVLRRFPSCSTDSVVYDASTASLKSSNQHCSRARRNARTLDTIPCVHGSCAPNDSLGFDVAMSTERESIDELSDAALNSPQDRFLTSATMTVRVVKDNSEQLQSASEIASGEYAFHVG